MWIADGWKDYEVLDTSGGEKLERWGDYLLVRPDPQVIWNTKKENPGWKIDRWKYFHNLINHFHNSLHIHIFFYIRTIIHVQTILPVLDNRYCRDIH